MISKRKKEEIVEDKQEGETARRRGSAALRTVFSLYGAVCRPVFIRITDRIGQPLAARSDFEVGSNNIFPCIPDTGHG